MNQRGIKTVVKEQKQKQDEHGGTSSKRQRWEKDYKIATC